MEKKLLIISERSILSGESSSKLEESGYAVITASEITEALKILDNPEAHIVLIDEKALPSIGSRNYKKLLKFQANNFLILLRSKSRPGKLTFAEFNNMGIDYFLPLEFPGMDIDSFLDLINEITFFDILDILIVSEDRDLCKQIEKALLPIKDSISINFADSGSSAVEILVSGKCNLLLADRTIKGKPTPFDMIELIIDDPEVNTPVILLEKENNAEFCRQAFLKGAEDVINLNNLRENGSIICGRIRQIALKSRKERLRSKLLLLQSPFEPVGKKSEEKDRSAADSMLFEQLFHNAINGIFLIDSEGIIQRYNDKADSMFGFKSATGHLGKNILTLFDPDDNSDRRLSSYIKNREDTSYELTLTGIQKNMTVFPVEVHLSLLPDNTEADILIFVRDITEREQRKSEMQQQNQELFLLYHISQEIRKEDDFTNILSIILEKSLEFSQSDYGAVYLLDREILKREAFQKTPQKSKFEPEKTIKLSKTHYKIKVKKNETASLTGHRSSISVPIISREKLVGILQVYSSKLNHFHGWKVRVLDTLCNQTGIVIENAQLLTRLEERGRQLQNLSDKLIKVQEEERKNISQELHDEIGQSISLIKIYLQMIIKDLTDAGDSKEAQYHNILKLLDDTISAIRDMATRIHPMVLDDLGLISAVTWYLSTFMKDSEIDFKFKHPGIFPSLDPEKRLVMFRVLTEAVHNAVKYSSATQITIELKRIGKKKIGLSVKDNGKGFDFEEVYNKSKSLPGIGLLAMNERATHIKADCEILTSEGKGCLVKLTVPM